MADWLYTSCTSTNHSSAVKYINQSHPGSLTCQPITAQLLKYQLITA